jgi:hypothetical protein
VADAIRDCSHRKGIVLDSKEDIDEMTALLAAQPEDQDQITAEIQHSQRVLKMISAVVGD